MCIERKRQRDIFHSASMYSGHFLQKSQLLFPHFYLNALLLNCASTVVSSVKWKSQAIRHLSIKITLQKIMGFEGSTIPWRCAGIHSRNILECRHQLLYKDFQGKVIRRL